MTNSLLHWQCIYFLSFQCELSELLSTTRLWEVLSQQLLGRRPNKSQEVLGISQQLVHKNHLAKTGEVKITPLCLHHGPRLAKKKKKILLRRTYQ